MQSCFMRQFIHSAWRCDCLHVFDLLLSRPYGGINGFVARSDMNVEVDFHRLSPNLCCICHSRP